MRRAPPPGLSRGALLAFGAAALATSGTGCTSTTPATDDVGLDANYGIGGDVYGAPDMGPVDAGVSSDDAGSGEQ